jgi:hypothetical protein
MRPLVFLLPAAQRKLAKTKVQPNKRLPSPCDGMREAVGPLPLVVVTVTVAVPVPELKALGAIEQLVPAAAGGRRQVKFTCDANPFTGETVMAF